MEGDRSKLADGAPLKGISLPAPTLAVPSGNVQRQAITDRLKMKTETQIQKEKKMKNTYEIETSERANPGSSVHAIDVSDNDRRAALVALAIAGDECAAADLFNEFGIYAN